MSESDHNYRQHSRSANSTNGISATSRHNNFDQNHRRYRTCCSCHLRSCSLIIGILETIGVIAGVTGTVVAYFALQSEDTKNSAIGLLGHAELSLIGAVTAFVIGSTVLALLFFGLVRERPVFLIPHLIVQLTAIIGLAGAVVVFVYVTIMEADFGPGQMTTIFGNRSRDRHNHPDYVELVYGGIVIGLCGLACALEIYFVIVIYRTYAYLHAKREARVKTPVIQLRAATTSFLGQDSVAAQRYWAQ